MPHIVVSDFDRFDTPAKKGDFKFLWFASEKGGGETIVGCEYGEKGFVISIKKREGEYIVKSDKITRLSPVSVMQKALKSFCDLASCRVTRSNIGSIKEHHLEKSDSFLKDIDFFANSFPIDKEIWIEIGFGSGRHLLHQAKNNKDIRFIGVEIHRPSIDQLLKQIEINRLENLFVVDYDARLFMEMVPSNLAGKIFVHFPVPWDKKPHRRVISDRFVKESLRALKPGGVLEVRTDSENYFRYTFETFLKLDSARIEIGKNIEPEISSKYEDRWRRLDKNIYDLRLVNETVSDPIDLEFDFDFSEGVDKKRIFEIFDTSPMKFEDFFIHFEKLYEIDQKSAVMKLSFGAFDRPEHKYIVILPNKCEYFPKKPILSKANVSAHKKIEEILYGQ